MSETVLRPEVTLVGASELLREVDDCEEMAADIQARQQALAARRVALAAAYTEARNNGVSLNPEVHQRITTALPHGPTTEEEMRPVLATEPVDWGKGSDGVEGPRIYGYNQ